MSNDESVVTVVSQVTVPYMHKIVVSQVTVPFVRYSKRPLDNKLFITTLLEYGTLWTLV
jgi:hypothetical protein